MSVLNRSVSLRYEATLRAGWRRRADETEHVAFHEIGHMLVKLSVEHAHAVHNLARVSELLQQVRAGYSTAAANGHECVTGPVDPGLPSV
jgi:hypothetical protein